MNRIPYFFRLRLSLPCFVLNNMVNSSSIIIIPCPFWVKFKMHQLSAGALKRKKSARSRSRRELPLSVSRAHSQQWMHFWTFSALLSMLTRWARERTRAFVIGNSRWDVSSAKIYRCSINSLQYFIYSYSTWMGEAMWVHDVLADGGRKVNELAALWDWAISRITLMSRESQVSPLIKTWNPLQT